PAGEGEEGRRQGQRQKGEGRGRREGGQEVALLRDAIRAAAGTTWRRRVFQIGENMIMRRTKVTLFAVGLPLVCALSHTALGGQEMKWEQVPEAVRTTVLANGGKIGSVDLEGEKIHGKAVYEAVGKDKKGQQVDLVITEDGKLVEIKYDGAPDK